MTNSSVESRSLQVARGGDDVLHGLDFAVSSGTVTGLLGPSGCGKTTLMRAVVGTQAIRSGSLTVLGRPAGAADLRGRVGYASQAASVYVDLTVEENVRYFAQVVSAPPGDVARVIDRVDMTGYRHRLAGRLSGGQRSRVSLAVALLGDPPLLVLDEPTVGLDPVLREDLWHLFHDLAANGSTLLVSSHVMDEAERCDDLLLLRDGTLLAHEPPAELRRRTGTDSLDAAFLRLIGEADAA